MDSHRSKHHIRMRSFCCNLAAAFAFIGLLFLTSAIVLYILATTDPSVGTIFQELLDKATFESSPIYPSVGGSNRLPMFIASGIGAIGVALVIIAILFICVSCVSASECFNNRGCEFRSRTGAQDQQKCLIELDKMQPDKCPSTVEQERPLIARSPHFNRHIPVAIDEIENGSFEEGNRMSILVPADFNLVGLPSANNSTINIQNSSQQQQQQQQPQQHHHPRHHPQHSTGMTANGVWIPPNGFSYLKNPADLENFYQENRASGRFQRISHDDHQQTEPTQHNQQKQQQILV